MEILSSIAGYETVVGITTVAIVTVIAILIHMVTFICITQSNKKLPPGSLGFPFIGETISFVRSLQQNKSDEWFQDRIDKYGPVFKTTIMGKKTIVVTGQAGNRFVLSGNSNNGLAANQPATLAKIIGKNSMMEYSGSRHKLIRKAVQSFLDPESIQRYVSHADLIVKQQIFQVMNGNESIIMVPFIRRITFNVACNQLFGISEGPEESALYEDFTLTFKALYSIPLNLPGTTFHTALQARARICKRLSAVIKQRKEGDMKLGHDHEDVISSFLNLRDENGHHVTENEILDNLIALIFASHDTLTSVICLFIQKLARSTDVYDKVLEEQREVVKASNGKITWSEIQLMRYTWNVAQELMRIFPPAFGGFRYAAKDTTFNKYDIPKGWQVFWAASPTHLDKDVFEDPKIFNPARFDNQSKALIPPYTYIPFGAGLRICPGSEYARIQILLVIHHLVTNYIWQEMIVGERITYKPTPYPAMGLPIKIYHKRATPK